MKENESKNIRVKASALASESGLFLVLHDKLPEVSDDVLRIVAERMAPVFCDELINQCQRFYKA